MNDIDIGIFDINYSKEELFNLLNEVVDDSIEKKIEIKRLNKIIDKAIEYIEKELKTDFDTYYYDIHMRNKRHLLNILRGVE